MIPVLLDNPERKFSYVEQAYFSRWWNEQTASTQEKVRQLVANGQLQFNLGGWAMNDEVHFFFIIIIIIIACPTLSEVVRQMTDGQQFILRQFGDSGRPTVGWHIDPFGHSYVTGGLWSEVGFDAFAMWRINYRQQEQRQQQQNLEFVWKGSSSLGDQGYIWVHLFVNLYIHICIRIYKKKKNPFFLKKLKSSQKKKKEDSGYCAPNEISFYWSTFIQTDPRLPSYPTNYIQLAESLMEDARTRRNWYRHEHVLMPFGCDFAHQNAYQSMTQMDKLMEYMNSNATYNVTITYSTFADRENVLRPAEQWFAFAQGLDLFRLYPDVFNQTLILNNITYLRNALDCAQHHDGISGTSTQSTTNDFMYMLQQGTDRVLPFTEQVAPYYLKKGSNIPTLVRNESLISSLSNDNVLVVVLYNSLAWAVTEMVEIGSNVSQVSVFDSGGNEIVSQVNQVTQYAQPFSTPCHYIIFFQAALPPLSFSTFFVALADSDIAASRSSLAKVHRVQSLSSYSIGDAYYSLNFSVDSQNHGVYLTGLYNRGLAKYFPLNNTWAQYISTGGLYSDGLQVLFFSLFLLFDSGHYIFRPAQDNRYTLASSTGLTVVNTLAFRQPFSSAQPAPGFIVAAHGDGQYNDTFVPTVCGYDLGVGNFTYRYHRVDGGSYWGQNPSIDFLVFDSSQKNESFHFNAKQRTYGTVSVSAKQSQSQKVNIAFSKGAYLETPALVVSVRGSDCSSGASYAAVITSIDTNGADVMITRIDSNSNWDEDVFWIGLPGIRWKVPIMVYDHSCSLFSNGKATLTVPANTNSVININFTFGNSSDFVVNEPVVLYSLQQMTPNPNGGTVYNVATTSVYNGKKGFGLNVFPVSSFTTSVTYQVTFLAFERNVLYRSINPPVDVVFIEGPLVSEMQQVWQANYSQTYRVFNVDSDDFKYVD
ncbi:hypothetical protein RFI_28169, partial [Reticulomyxa filosa]